MIGSGHLSCHLLMHRNPCKCSQQGWEAWNQKLKHCHFNNTNHGGNNGNSNADVICGEHMRPIMRMNQRSMLWLLGIGDKFFESMESGEMESNGSSDNVV